MGSPRNIDICCKTFSFSNYIKIFRRTIYRTFPLIDRYNCVTNGLILCRNTFPNFQVSVINNYTENVESHHTFSTITKNYSSDKTNFMSLLTIACTEQLMGIFTWTCTLYTFDPSSHNAVNIMWVIMNEMGVGELINPIQASLRSCL